MRYKTAQRFELKYILHSDQVAAVSETLLDYIETDDYGDAQGRYTVTSLYFDSADYKAYWDKLEGHPYRRKLRVRVYGNQVVTPQTRCFVEIKQRLYKTVSKRRVVLPHEQAMESANYRQLATTLSPDDAATLQEALYLHDVLQLRPTCIVRYDRLAFNGGQYDPGLRITFDSDLKFRVHDLSLLSETYADNRYFLPPHWYIMEIKINHRVPYWLTEIIGKHSCTQRRISKYCTSLEVGEVSQSRQRITEN
ncbi:MAG: polyphosphate polymerase domain-containing protein [Chloroflexi bacterium]|nr:polyphosphate polymerase domain-containing protein [Chloroflexota bacterium]